MSTRIIPREEALAMPDLLRLAMAVPDRDMIRVVEIEGIEKPACVVDTISRFYPES